MLNGIASIEPQVIAPIVATSPVVAPKSADTPAVQDSLPPFVSPAIRVDPIADQVVLEFRDSESGEVLKQVPSPSQVQAAYAAKSDGLAPVESSAVRVDISDAAIRVSTTPVKNNVQSSQSLGPSVPLGDGDTSSFSV